MTQEQSAHLLEYLLGYSIKIAVIKYRGVACNLQVEAMLKQVVWLLLPSWIFLFVRGSQRRLTTVDNDQKLDENVSKKLCFETDQDFDKPLEGQWILNKSSEYVGVFDRTNSLSHWNTADYFSVCPFQMAPFSCYMHGRGSQEENQTYETSSCDMEKFSPKRFLSEMRNKKIVFVGDSVSMQMFTSLTCSLHYREFNPEYKIDWFDISSGINNSFCQPGGQYCHVKYGISYYPDYDVQIILDFLHGIVPLQYFTDAHHLSSKDVLVLNHGLHYNSNQKLEFIEMVKKYAHEYAHADPATRPYTIWRETSPQHFKTPTGYYDPSASQERCQPYADIEYAYKNDFRNRLVDSIFSEVAVRMDIMRIWNITAPRYDVHLGYDANIEISHVLVSDCTHYCQSSGVFNVWRDIFFNMLLTAKKLGKMQVIRH